jgi:hypothetical protein
VSMAERALERVRKGAERTIPLEDVIKRHGVEGRAVSPGRPRTG